MLDLLRQPAACRDARRPTPRAARPDGRSPLAEVRLLAPLEPPTVRDFVTFEEHVEGVRQRRRGRRVPERLVRRHRRSTSPTRTRSSAPHDDVPVPPGCERLDFELEVAAVIGRRARPHPRAGPRPHRRLHRSSTTGRPGTCSPRDEGRPRALQGQGLRHHARARTWSPPTSWSRTATPTASCAWRCTRRGQRRRGRPGPALQHGLDRSRTSSPTPRRGTEVRPGDVLGSGTCGNGGCLAELWGRGRTDPPPLRPGDVVTMTVEGLGTLRNTVVAGREPHPIAQARPRPRTRP